MKIYKSGENPAHSLYDFWRDVLEAVGSNGVKQNSFVELSHGRRWGIHVVSETPKGEPVLGWGPVYGSSRWRTPGGYSFFQLAPDGRFQLGYMWGWERRDRIANGTFLRWNYVARQYAWYVDLSAGDGTYSDVLRNWRQPKFYVEERVLIPPFIYGSPRPLHPWMELRRGALGWEMAPSLNQAAPTEEPVIGGADYDDAMQRFEYNNRMRERRYRLAERRARIAAGETVPRLSAARRKVAQDDDEMVTQMVAALTVFTPAKTTPLTPRLKEATHGDHLVT